MLEKAQMFTPEQVQSFLYIMGGLVLSNASTIVGGVLAYLRRVRKMRRDIYIAHERIRYLKARVDALEKTQGE